MKDLLRGPTSLQQILVIRNTPNAGNSSGQWDEPEPRLFVFGIENNGGPSVIALASHRSLVVGPDRRLFQIWVDLF